MARLTVAHTSTEHSGQIDIDSITWALFIGDLPLISVFQSSQHLTTAYGLAATRRLLLTTALFLAQARYTWGWPTWICTVFGILVDGLELATFAAHLITVCSGGWSQTLIADVIIHRRSHHPGFGPVPVASGEFTQFQDDHACSA